MAETKRFHLDNYSGSKDDRIRTIMKGLVLARMTGKVEIHSDYQTLRFCMSNGKLAIGCSIASYADIIDRFE